MNKAHATLKQPLSRGLYLLNMMGCSPESADTAVDKDFLLEIMEVGRDRRVSFVDLGWVFNHGLFS